MRHGVSASQQRQRQRRCSCACIHGTIQVLLVSFLFLMVLRIYVFFTPPQQQQQEHSHRSSLESFLSEFRHDERKKKKRPPLLRHQDSVDMTDQELEQERLLEQMQEEEEENDKSIRRETNSEHNQLEKNNQPPPPPTNLAVTAQAVAAQLSSLQQQRHSQLSLLYPIGNRTIVLSQIPLCAAAKQPEPWRKNLPEHERPTTFLQINTECPDAPQRMKDILRNNNNNQNNNSDSAPKITLSLLYYQDIQLLSRQLASWLSWPAVTRQQYRFLILDNGSQVGWRAMDLIASSYYYHHLGDTNNNTTTRLQQRLLADLDLSLYEMEQNLPFNIGGARNLAHAVATTEYVLTTDADVYINSTVAHYLLQTLQQHLQNATTTKTHNKPTIWKFFNQLMPTTIENERSTTFEPHPAVMLASKKAYWALGGCDEDLVGHYGQTDILFLWKADRDPKAVHVISLLDHMQRRRLYLQKWWRLEEQTCHAQIRPCTPGGLTLPKFVPPMPRVLKYNLQTFAMKKQGKTNFSNTFLHFSWHKVDFLK